MKHYADTKRILGPDFAPGDKVWLLCKNLKTMRPSQKLDNRKIGPFSVVEKINSVAYRLKLPPLLQNPQCFPRLSPRALLHHPQTSGARAHLLRKWRAKKNGLLKPSLIPESVAAGCSALLSGKTGLIPRILGSLPHTSVMPTSSLPNSTICIPTNRAPVPSRSTPKDEATVRERG
ncbi:hypothetical protein PhCBS80983_g05850 [Powellomyces hirtus]|uniref:Tf2-1-like SH3-like domain-containing protein n=1 Tax=Powellomyces hirtus TaxID=109895 RepID=A0A507DTT0_9FUNG|nr:hypothetical protein PhCBS80983_g05850 [Powellomyces hirtus]